MARALVIDDDEEIRTLIRAMLEGVTDDPHAGGPYVMWGDTPYAHIMVPLEDANRSAPPAR